MNPPTPPASPPASQRRQKAPQRNLAPFGAVVKIKTAHASTVTSAFSLSLRLQGPTAISLAARCQTSSSQRALVSTPNSHWYQCRLTSQVDAPCPCPHSLAVCPRPRAFPSLAGVRLPVAGSVSSDTARAPTPASG